MSIGFQTNRQTGSRIKRLILTALAGGLLCLPPGTFGQAGPTNTAASPLVIRSVSVRDKPVLARRNEVNLGASPQNITFNFAVPTNSAKGPPRIRYKLDGFDTAWNESSSEMNLSIRFFNDAGDQVSQDKPHIYNVSHESDGWTGSLETSPLRHRREALTVPAQASRLWVTISSAGSPACVGIYVVANLVVSKHSDTGRPVVLLESPLNHSFDDETNRVPRGSGWIADGYAKSMAKIVAFGQGPVQKAFAIVDDDMGARAEWHNTMPSAPPVSPGDQILVEWNEMFSIGVGNTTSAHYAGLPPGSYQFEVAQFDVLGNQAGPATSVAVLVPYPVWQRSWFWSLLVTASVGFALAGGRYAAWHRMRRAYVRLKNQQSLEQERLRIAQDIHDDLGARITEISLASALAQKKQPAASSAGADFENISRMSRELISALYETVWAVNPENDNLEALGSFLCQMVNQLCEQAQLPCRLQISDLPRDIEVSSQTRHNIIMAVKEAVHNTVKHARATEIQVHMAVNDAGLTIRILDNGCGFGNVATPAGHGLGNMKRRLTDIGGDCTIESRAGGGTSVQFRLSVQAVKHRRESAAGPTPDDKRDNV